jgi:hypothetical protein
MAALGAVGMLEREVTRLRLILEDNNIEVSQKRFEYDEDEQTPVLDERKGAPVDSPDVAVPATV